MKFKATLLLTCATFLVGCAAQQPRPNNNMASFRHSSVAVAFILPQKRVFYAEQLYRVFWVTKNYSSIDISGIWEPENDMETVLSNSFNAAGIKTSTIHELVNADILRPYRTQAECDYLNNASRTTALAPELKDGPVDSYFLETPKYDAFPSLMVALHSQHVDYLVEVLVPDFIANAIGLGMVVVQMHGNIRITEIPSGKVIWTGYLHTSKSYQLGGDLHALEKDNLRLLKEGISAGLDKSLSLETMARLFGTDT